VLLEEFYPRASDPFRRYFILPNISSIMSPFITMKSYVDLWRLLFFFAECLHSLCNWSSRSLISPWLTSICISSYLPFVPSLWVVFSLECWMFCIRWSLIYHLLFKTCCVESFPQDVQPFKVTNISCNIE